MFDDLSGYFHENVWESYQRFTKSIKSKDAGKSRDLRLAMNAATALYHLREHIPQPQRKSRAALARVCSDYDLLGDVVNAAKHGSLTKGNPQVSSAEAIFEQHTSTMYHDEQGEYWHGEKSVFVKLKDGSERDLHEVLMNVLNMWLKELNELKVIPQVDPVEIEIRGIPPRLTKSGAAPLDLEIIRGVRFVHRARLQKYNYATGKVEPMDLTGAEVKFRIYKPPSELHMILKNDRTGEEISETVPLTEEHGRMAMDLQSDEERDDFVMRVAKEQGILERFEKEIKKRQKPDTKTFEPTA